MLKGDDELKVLRERFLSMLLGQVKLQMPKGKTEMSTRQYSEKQIAEEWEVGPTISREPLSA